MRKLGLLLILALAARLESATLIAGANGVFTAAATWQLVDATSYLDSEAGTVVVGVGNIDSAAFVPGAITVDGIAVKVLSRNAAPAANTFTVTLRNTTAGADVASVTINVSDINNVSPGGWYFVNFGNQLLIAGNNYIVRCVASAASMVTLYRNATANNVSRMLRTSTTQAPAANDQLHVLGEWTGAGAVTARTVTMDETVATSYGPVVAGGPPQAATIGKSGTVTWGTTGGVNYIFYLKGIQRVYSGGTLNIGTVGTPMPANSTALYEMNSAANVDSGLIVDGTLNIYGNTKNNVASLLTADLAGAGTVVTVTSTADWVALDTVVIASTTRTASQTESATIKSVDSPTQITLTAGVANAHSGTSPTQAEIINLTHNVLLRGASQLLCGFVTLTATAVSNVHYAEHQWLGSATATKTGIQFATGATGSSDMTYSSVHNWFAADSYLHLPSTAANVTLNHIVAYDLRRYFLVDNTAGVWTIQNSAFLGQSSSTLNQLDSSAGTFSNVTFAGGAGATRIGGTPVLSSLTSHSNTGGFTFTSAASGVVFNGVTTWRNTSAGGSAHAFRINVAGFVLHLNNVTSFGNETCTVAIDQAQVSVYLDTLVSNGDSTFATTSGVQVGVGPTYLSILDSDFSTVAGIKTAHTNDILVSAAGVIIQAHANNTIFAGVNVVGSLTTNAVNLGTIKSGLWSMKQGTTAGNHRRYLTMGNALTNTVTFRTASPSEELAPSSASVKMESGPKQAAVAAGNTVTWSVWVYKSVGYGGAQPRLILRANPAIGVATDTVLDTMAGGAGAWEELTGVTPAAAGDAGVFEAFVDCDTAGSVYVDDWSTNGTLISENRGWWNGTPMIVAGGQPIGGDTYWWTATPAVGFPPSAPAGGTVPVINNPILISRRQTVGRP